MPRLVLKLLPDYYAVCRLEENDVILERLRDLTFYAIIRTEESITIVCNQKFIIDPVECEKNWRCLEIEGPFKFSEIGIISEICGPLAHAKIPVYVISAFETDYLLIKDAFLKAALATLKDSGHQVKTNRIY
jgi:hypothetical protein